MLTYYILYITLFLCFIHIVFNYNSRARLMMKIPGPKGVFIAGNALDIIKSPVELFLFLRKIAKDWSTINRLWSFPFGAVNIYKPEHIELILSGVKHNTKSIFYNFLRPWLQDGLLLSDGKKWQNRRKVLTPAFHFNILREFFSIIRDNSQHLVLALHKCEGKPIDVVPIISEYTLHTICETAMGTQLDQVKSESGKAYKNAIYKLGSLIVYRSSRTYLYLNFMYYLSMTGKLEKKFLNIIHSFTEKVIKFRKSYIRNHGNNIERNENNIEDADVSRCSKKRTAMLDLLISAEKDGLIDSNGIQEEVDTFMFEGHDTTACGLTYILMLLANHKDIQEKITDELNDIFAGSNRRANIDDLTKMRYLERCIKESLRLYPPVPLIGRILSEEVKLGGYVIPPSTYCIIHIYDLHRREDLYKDPLVFDPDRFLPENSVGRHPYAYIPFSAGPRNCIGQKFAMMEMKSAVSEILRNFVLMSATQPENLQFTVDLVLRTTGPVLITFAKR